MRQRLMLIRPLFLLMILLILATFAFSQQHKKDFTLSVGPFRGNIQWEESSDRINWTSVLGGTVNTFQVHPEKTTYYRAKIVEQGCDPIYSDTKAVVVDGGASIGARIIQGKVILPAQSSVNLTELTVQSFVGENKVKSDGSFEVVAIDSTAEQVLLVKNRSGEVIIMGYFLGEQQVYQLNAETTATALLVLFPFLKPVETQDKGKYINAYKREPEFKQLVSQVEAILMKDSGLFAHSNTDVRQTIYTLIHKDFNKDRLRTMRTQSWDRPVEIFSSAQHSVTISNYSSHNYVGAIYRKSDGEKVVPAFNIAGDLLTNSSVMQKILGGLIGSDQMEWSRTFNLANYTQKPGEFEVRLRDGLALDGTDENYTAACLNIYTAAGQLISNLVDYFFLQEKIPGWDNCFKENVSAFLTASKILYNYDPGTSKIFYDLIFPIINSIASNRQGCLGEKVSSFLSASFSFLSFASEVYASAKFVSDWSFSRHTIDGCQYLDKDLKSSSCFIIAKDNDVFNSYNTCDTAVLKIKSVENNQYYPYQSNPVPYKEFLWITMNGAFMPDGAIKSADKTDADGKASIKWLLPGKDDKSQASAIAALHGDTISLATFNTTTKTPHPKVDTAGSGQSSMINEPLSKYLGLWIKDENNNSAMPPEDFYIQWKVVKGGGQEPAYVTTALNQTAWQWTLGPEVGEQIVEATITKRDNNSCNWEISNSTVRFTATATVDYVFSKVTTSSLSAEAGQILSTPLVVKVWNAAQKPIPGIDIQWITQSGNVSGTTQTDAAGEATAQWTLGTALGNQAFTVKALYQGKEIPGSPVTFSAKALGYRVSKISGDNQSGFVNKALPLPLVVKVTDQDSVPVGNVEVNWRTPVGSLSESKTQTDATGATKVIWTLGNVAAEQIAIGEVASNKYVSGSPFAFHGSATAPAVISYGKFGAMWTMSGPSCADHNIVTIDLFSQGDSAWADIRMFDYASSTRIGGHVTDGVFHLEYLSYPTEHLVVDLTLNDDKKSVTGTFGWILNWTTKKYCTTEVFTAIIGFTPPPIISYGKFDAKWTMSGPSCADQNIVTIDLFSQGDSAWAVIRMFTYADTTTVRGHVTDGSFHLEYLSYPNEDVIMDLKLSGDKNSVTGTFGWILNWTTKEYCTTDEFIGIKE